MKEYRVLVAMDMEESQLREIAAIDSRLRVDSVVEEFGALLGSTARGIAMPKEGESLDPATAESRLAPLLKEAEILYTRRVLPDLLKQSPKLRWVHLVSHGVDRFQGDLLESDVTITTGQGSHAEAVAEHTMALILMLARGMPCFSAQQLKHRWEKRLQGVELSQSTLGLVGLGSIGKQIAHYAKAFGMRVIATRRTLPEAPPPEVDEMVPRERLDYLLKESDFLVLALSLTPDTLNLIGERELRLMKPSAFLINISRGGIIDEPALIRALQDQWITGAGLDVFQVEPLPADSPLWDMPNVIVTPHVGGYSPHFVEHANRLFMENLRRYLNGKPLLNVFDQTRGY
ncbi:D-2-hydroxyacid dehydrogenase [Chloroflexota bacterium]